MCTKKTSAMETKCSLFRVKKKVPLCVRLLQKFCFFKKRIGIKWWINKICKKKMHKNQWIKKKARRRRNVWRRCTSFVRDWLVAICKCSMLEKQCQLWRLRIPVDLAVVVDLEAGVVLRWWREKNLLIGWMLLWTVVRVRSRCAPKLLLCRMVKNLVLVSKVSWCNLIIIFLLRKFFVDNRIQL